MPLRWKSAPRQPSTYRVLEVTLAAPKYAIINHDRSTHVTKTLHWLDPQKRTVPCLDEDCPWCHLPQRETTYAPCLYLDGQLWRIGIMPFTQRMLAFMDLDFAKKVYKFFRVARYNGKIGWEFHEALMRHVMPVPPIDVKPSVEHMWGEYVNYKIRPRISAETLDFNRDAEGGAA